MQGHNTLEEISTINSKYQPLHVSTFFHFYHTLFCWLEGASVNPGSFSLHSHFVHSLVYEITHSFLNGQTYVSTCMLYLPYNFKPKVNT